MTTKEVLIAARARIDKPQKWCKGRLDNERGRRCALGAVENAFTAAGRDPRVGEKALQRAIHEVLGLQLCTVGEFNDDSTHAEVMELFDRAIEAAS